MPQIVRLTQPMCACHRESTKPARGRQLRKWVHTKKSSLYQGSISLMDGVCIRPLPFPRISPKRKMHRSKERPEPEQRLARMGHGSGTAVKQCRSSDVSSGEFWAMIVRWVDTACCLTLHLCCAVCVPGPPCELHE